MSIKHFLGAVTVFIALTFFPIFSNLALAAGTTTTTNGSGQVQTQTSGDSLNLTTNLSATATPSGIPNPDWQYLPPGFARSLPDLLASLLTLLVAIVAVLVFAYLIWGGLSWITSGGDKGKTDSARAKIMAAIIGLVIIASSYAVLQIILRFMGYTSLIDAFNKIKPVSEPGRTFKVEVMQPRG